MLKHLTIRNYALIRFLEMEPSSHLNVITGETGAGKSIMLGAIGLLMGNRADTKVLWDENE
jgi:DNA repair protein RecN (Recombination protein N)